MGFQENKQFFDNMAGNSNMIMALAGNKADLEDRRNVPAEVSCTFWLSNVSCPSSFIDIPPIGLCLAFLYHSSWMQILIYC